MRALFLALVPAGVALAVLAYEVEVDSLNTGDARAVAPVAAGLSFLVCGLIAWSRRPANRLGALMVATGFALLLRQLRYSHDALAFTVFFALGDLGFAVTSEPMHGGTPFANILLFATVERAPSASSASR